MSEAISRSPELCTRVLKVVNSAFYGLPGQVSSVPRAVGLVGLVGIRNVAIAASLTRVFQGRPLSVKFSPRNLWTHSLAVGATARLVATATMTPLADEALLAGLIHDIGLMVELQYRPRQAGLGAGAARGGRHAGCPGRRRSLLWRHPPGLRSWTLQALEPSAVAHARDGRPVVALGVSRARAPAGDDGSCRRPARCALSAWLSVRSGRRRDWRRRARRAPAHARPDGRDCGEPSSSRRGNERRSARAVNTATRTGRQRPFRLRPRRRRTRKSLS